MCDAEGNGLESLMGVFRLPNADVRVCAFCLTSISLSPLLEFYQYSYFDRLCLCCLVESCLAKKLE